VFDKKVKIECVPRLRAEYKAAVARHKLSTLAHVEDQLVNKPKIDIAAFLSLCAVEGAAACYLSGKMYYVFDPLRDSAKSESDSVFVIRRSPPSRTADETFSCQKILMADLAEHIKGRLPMNAVHKPIKSVSAYTADQLTEMCRVLGVPIPAKKTKQTMYAGICACLFM